MGSRWIAFVLPILLLTGCENEREAAPLNPAATGQNEEPPAQVNGPNDVGEPEALHTATGQVESVDPQSRQITIAHDPVKSLGWPEMTMPFTVQDPRVLQGIKAGANIEFTFREGPAGEYTITEVRER